MLGDADGNTEGTADGAADGAVDGAAEGVADGIADGLVEKASATCYATIELHPGQQVALHLQEIAGGS